MELYYFSFLFYQKSRTLNGAVISGGALTRNESNWARHWSRTHGWHVGRLLQHAERPYIRDCQVIYFSDALSSRKMATIKESRKTLVPLYIKLNKTLRYVIAL